MRHELVGKVTPDERHEACRSSQQRTIRSYVESVLQQLLLQIMYVLASCRDDRYGLLSSVVVRFRTAIWSGLSEVHYLVIEVPLKHLVALHTAIGDHCGPSDVKRRKRRKVGGWVHASLGRILALAFREFLQHVITYAAGLEDPTRDILLQCLADWTLCRMRGSILRSLFLAEHTFTEVRAAGKCPMGAGLIRGGAAPGGLGDLVEDFIFVMTPSRDGDLDAIIESQLNVPDGGKRLVKYRAIVFDDKGPFHMMQSVDGGSEFLAPRLERLPTPTPNDAAGADTSDSDADPAD